MIQSKRICMECGYITSTTQGVAKGVNSHVCILVIALVGTGKTLLMQVFVRVDGMELTPAQVPQYQDHHSTM